MGWPSTSAAITSLRALIFDGMTDKMCSNKKVLGVIDGVNSTFKTFEYRRIGSLAATGMSVVAYPQGVFINGAQVNPSLIADDPATGTFQLDISTLPNNRDSLTATYYYQWYLDADLDTFLQNSATWLGLGPQYQNVPDGLNAALLRFAAQEAYEQAAMKYSTRMSETYKLEDAPSEDILKSIDAFQKMADNFMDKASKLRDDYYTRQGQSLAPNFSFSLGRVIDPTPRR